MNGKVCKKLRQVAAGIPPIEIKRVQRLSKLGRDLTAADRALLAPGTTVFAKKRYYQDIVVNGFVNHYNVIKELYEAQGGDEAVLKYCTDMRILANKIKREMAGKLLNRLP